MALGFMALGFIRDLGGYRVYRALGLIWFFLGFNYRVLGLIRFWGL